jgi:hypothetical protein
MDSLKASFCSKRSFGKAQPYLQGIVVKDFPDMFCPQSFRFLG